MSVLSVDIDWITNKNEHSILVDYVTKYFKTCEQIIFIDSHHSILNYISEEDKSIVNIDTHHDILNDPSFSDIHTLNEGNWVGHLIFHKKLENYIWIHKIDSLLQEETLSESNIRDLKTFKMETSFDIIQNFKYKKIIICKSKEYFWEQRYLDALISFDILKVVAKNIFKEKVIIDNTSNPYTRHNL